ncbi:NAD(P)-dependent oxidoreductase [Gramella sp. BOM4]|nr:NAD(P)-dependent oxidoreductase [Christiangramia bathymodioli]
MQNSDLSGQKVLVTGATGFIGHRLSEILSNKGAIVTGAGRNLDKARDLEGKGIKLLKLDLTNDNELDDALKDVTYVFHCAGALGGDDKSAELVNETATRMLVETAGKNGVKRVVHVSTVGVYDMSRGDIVNETYPLALDHSATYPRTKARGEKLAFESGKRHNVEVVVIRPSMVYGPGDGVWTRMMYKNVCEGKPVYLGDGHYNFNPVYLDDVVEAMIKAASVKEANGEAFNISSEVTTWKKFMSYYGEACDKKPKGIPLFMAKAMAAANKIPGVKTPIDKGFIEMATSNKFFPVAKAEKILNWKPTTSLEQGMQRTIAWLKDNKGG